MFSANMTSSGSSFGVRPLRYQPSTMATLVAELRAENVCGFGSDAGPLGSRLPARNRSTKSPAPPLVNNAAKAAAVLLARTADPLNVMRDWARPT